MPVVLASSSCQQSSPVVLGTPWKLTLGTSSLYYFDVSSQLHDIQDENSELRSRLDDINAEVDHLNELSKLLSVRTCNEMQKFGVNKSDYYIIDPDGPLNGKEPKSIFSKERVLTTIHRWQLDAATPRAKPRRGHV